MQSWQDRAIKAFETFVARGQDVISCFDKGEVDLALKNLSRRNAAIANFRVYDAKCTAYNFSQLEALEKLSVVAVQENLVIEKRLKMQKEVEHKNLRHVMETRKKISRYKSSQEASNLIERSI